MMQLPARSRAQVRRARVAPSADSCQVVVGNTERGQKGMPRHVLNIEINSETAREELEQCVLAAEHSNAINIQMAAAQARAELWRREQQAWTERFNAESKERVKAQRFQEAQVTRQIEAQENSMGQQLVVAEKQAGTAGSAAQAARWSAVATVAIAVLTAVLAVIAVIAFLSK